MVIAFGLLIPTVLLLFTGHPIALIWSREGGGRQHGDEMDAISSRVQLILLFSASSSTSSTSLSPSCLFSFILALCSTFRILKIAVSFEKSTNFCRCNCDYWSAQFMAIGCMCVRYGMTKPSAASWCPFLSQVTTDSASGSSCSRIPVLLHFKSPVWPLESPGLFFTKTINVSFVTSARCLNRYSYFSK